MPSTSLISDGGIHAGSPAGKSPTIATPDFTSDVSDMTAVAKATTSRAIGRCGRNFSPSSNRASAPKPKASTVQLV